MHKNLKVSSSSSNQALQSISNGGFECEKNACSCGISSMFCSGSHYCYVIDFFDMELKHVCPKIETLLGLNSHVVQLNDFIKSIHPDDVAYVAKAEEQVVNYFYANLDQPNIFKFKASYCFRLRIIDGSYQLFQHQAVLISMNEKGGLGRFLNTHTNIHHITKVNNHKVYIVNLEDEADIVELDVNAGVEKLSYSSFFSKRESEIIDLITLGFKNDEIADKLFISVFTVKNHRQNILHKSGVRSSAELVAKCINEGLI